MGAAGAHRRNELLRVIRLANSRCQHVNVSDQTLDGKELAQLDSDCPISEIHKESRPASKPPPGGATGDTMHRRAYRDLGTEYA